MQAQDLLARLIAGIERELEGAVALRRRLHAAPELAHEEHATAAAIEHELPVQALAAAGTGRLALIGDEAPGAPVAVRAELDGLPVRERTEAAFSADGEVMHACGHDVHMAALVALARAAQDLPGSLPAPLLAVFQPSEEAYPSGAEELARGELARIAPRAVVAAHVHPQLAWRTVALDAGAVNASCDNFRIAIEGRPSHAAYPHLGRDPVLALAQVIVALHALAGRRTNPLHASVINIGVLEGGAAENVIPERASASGSLRAHDPVERETLRAMLLEVVEGVAAAHGCRGTVSLSEGEPPLENDPAIVEQARALLSASGLQPAPPWRSCGSDDFAFLGAVAPLAMGFVGLDGADGFRPRPLHHPELLVPDEAVGIVARTQALLYVACVAATGGFAGPAAVD